jgi:disulfide oxidoreductase YuzD
MNCDICGKTTTNENGICDSCNKIMEHVIREIGPDRWEKIEDCKYIYPMVKRVAEGSLRTQDIVNELLKGEMD